MKQFDPIITIDECPEGIDATEHLLFVYGTLQKGQTNHNMLIGARFVREAVTKEANFELTVIDGTPGCIRPGRFHVKGEVFSVSDETLATIDNLEKLGVDYMRQKIKLIDYPYEAWIYMRITDSRHEFYSSVYGDVISWPKGE